MAQSHSNVLAQPTGEKWRVSQSISGVFKDWSEGKPVTVLGIEHLDRAVLMINEAIRLLNPELAVPTVNWTLSSLAIVQQQTGGADNYSWAAQPIVNSIRGSSGSVIRRGNQSLKAALMASLYSLLAVALLARAGFPMPPTLASQTKEAAIVFEGVASKVAQYR